MGNLGTCFTVHSVRFRPGQVQAVIASDGADIAVAGAQGIVNGVSRAVEAAGGPEPGGVREWVETALSTRLEALGLAVAGPTIVRLESRSLEEAAIHEYTEQADPIVTSIHHPPNSAQPFTG